MESTIFGYIRKYSWRQQITVLVMTLASLPFFYASLELPKLIINDALSDIEGPRALFGFEMEQLRFLFVLCGLFLLLVLVNGGFKYVINVYKGILGERMLRRLRYELYSRVLRFPLPHFRKISQGELVQMINAEVEPLGGFIGDAYSLPAYQGGMLLTILAFMFIQDPIMGLAAIFLYPLQVYIIPKLQRQVNLLGKARVKQVRRIAERIGETAQGVRDIRANDASKYERARFTHELGIIFHIRFDIYRKKFFIKFLNNFLAQLGPFFFYMIGGYLVIQGDLTIGALVAVIAAHEKLSAPWKELLTYYQFMSDARIKYDQVVSQFDPSGIKDPELQDGGLDPDLKLDRELRLSNLVVLNDDDEPIIKSASGRYDLPQKIAITGPSGSGKEELVQLIAGLLEPDRGRVTFNDHAIADINEATLSKNIGYVGNPVQIMAGTIEENLLFALKNNPVIDRVVEHQLNISHKDVAIEASKAGNSTQDPFDVWVDYAALGIADPDIRRHRFVEVLKMVNFDQDVYTMGLKSPLKGEKHETLRGRILALRGSMLSQLHDDPALAKLVEPFEPEAYNINATVAENLLFGTPVGDVFDEDNLHAHDYVITTLRETGLLDEMRAVGFKLAQTMVELFADLPPDHEYFSQFSFISAEDLPEFKSIVARTDVNQLDQLNDAQRQQLLSLPFKLIVNRHRLGLIDEPIQAKLVKARQYFRDHLPPELVASIDFFEPSVYNEAASIIDNILFGKIVHGQAQAQEKMLAKINAMLLENGLDDDIVEVGLESECGVSGARLSPVQRQKLGWARVLMKRPQILILHDPGGPMDNRDQEAVRDAILASDDIPTVIWALQQDDWAAHFDYEIKMQDGQIIAQGPVEKTE